VRQAVYVSVRVRVCTHTFDWIPLDHANILSESAGRYACWQELLG